MNFAKRCSERDVATSEGEHSECVITGCLIVCSSPVQLVSPLQICRWSFFLTSLFIIMSTKFDQSSSCFKNERRQSLFSRAVLCSVFSISS